ncbi:MAG: cysteine synthase family protein [Anaerolineae bacterium]|nr:cysteine synthase family protein [Anaerolineae bacterium]
MTSLAAHVAPAVFPRPRLVPKTGAEITALIGNTPLLRLPNVTAYLPPGVEVYAKAEWTSPGGSVKDRPAYNIMTQAIRRGDLRPGVTLIDSTSGNMGIAYSMIGRALGYPVELVLPANASPERIAILRAYGAALTLSDPAEGSDGAIRKVRELYAANPDKYFYADQYGNPDNWRAHYHTTGVEIWQQTYRRVTHFVAGLGTSGTMMGVGRRLRRHNPDVKLIAVQPDSAFHGLEGLKHMPTAIVPPIYDSVLLDEIVAVRTEEAHAMCRRLARAEGVLVGVSAGAALAGALRVAERLDAGTVVTLFPDGASKYLSDPFWTEGAS